MTARRRILPLVTLMTAIGLAAPGESRSTCVDRPVRTPRDAAAVFPVRGRLAAGTTVVLTIRVGDRCAQDTMTLRPERAALVFP